MVAVSSTNTVWHEWTSACAGTRVVNGHCATCHEPASSSWQISPTVRVSGNCGDVVRISVQGPVPGVVDAEEILSEPPPPWHKAYARYTPRVKSVVPVWEQRQILRQQRPRDGLK
jgi:hypothetical protein